MVKQSTSKTRTQQVERSSPLEIVLQWLTYAFWGLLLAGLMWLVVIVLNLLIRGEVFESVTPYALAATFVLLPITCVADWLYRKHEPAKKAGMSAVVMVIHAVLFALIAIGTLIGAVFTTVAWLISTSSDNADEMITLVSLMIATALYAALFVRTISPLRPKKLSMWFAVCATIIAVGLLIWGVTGPVTQSIARKDDRRIAEFTPAVSESVNQYVDENGELPRALDDLEDISRDGRALIDDNLVEYKKGAVTDLPTQGAGEREYRYQLCVTYENASSRDGSAHNESYSDYGGVSREGYTDYLYISSYPAGEVCYKLRATTLNFEAMLDVE